MAKKSKHTTILAVPDTICNGCVIRPLENLGAGARYLVTRIATGEAREVEMPHLCSEESETVATVLTAVITTLKVSRPVKPNH